MGLEVAGRCLAPVHAANAGPYFIYLGGPGERLSGQARYQVQFVSCPEVDSGIARAVSGFTEQASLHRFRVNPGTARHSWWYRLADVISYFNLCLFVLCRYRPPIFTCKPPPRKLLISLEVTS